MESILTEIKKIGRMLKDFNLITTHSGNISIIDGDCIYITKHGAMLSELNNEDIIKVKLFEYSEEASFELPVHQIIYSKTNAKAIIHAHPIFAITLSFYYEKIKPIDSEGKILLKEVPVIAAEETVGSKEVGNILGDIFNKNKVAIVKGHGSFSIGDTLREALCYTSSLEASCKIIYYCENRY